MKDLGTHIEVPLTDGSKCIFLNKKELVKMIYPEILKALSESLGGKVENGVPVSLSGWLDKSQISCPIGDSGVL